MADAIVSAVAEQMATILKEQIQNEVSLVRGVENEIDSLSKELQNVRNKLEDAERKQFADKSVRSWLVRLEDASYEMEDVLDEWHTALRKFQIQQHQQYDAPPPKYKVCSLASCLCFQKVAVRHDIATKIKNVKVKLDLILAEKDRYGLMTSSPSTTVDPPSWRVQSTSLVDLAEVHGRDIDMDIVASKIFVTMSPSDQVETEERQLETVSIVGKTTLAQLIFNDSRVKDCYELAIWVCVSYPFDVTEIIKKIVESVTRRYQDSNQLQVLVQLLKECISGKKFLLVLDYVWTEDHIHTKWESLKICLKLFCGIGSKILVTTRNEKVAKMFDTLENGIHRLGVLSNESCWLLLKRIALFGRDEGECAKYIDIGMKIVDKCKGLPLAAKTLGSLLRSKNGLVEWENVLNNEIWDLEEAKVDIFPHLLLSYNELSPALKRCFSYCAVFPKDSEIVVEEVIIKWMALGYLGSDIESGSDEIELRGRQYFDTLAMRSLFQDFTEIHSIYSFKLHDIVHDFARFLRKNGTVVMEAETNKKTSCQACSPEFVSQVKEYRSLFLDDKDSLICGCLGIVRVLSLRKYTGIPEGIEKLIHLRWLDLSENRNLSGKEGLETICNELCNLQTLLLQFCELEEIPRGIGNLICLRHLNLQGNALKEFPREIWNLINLRHLDLSWNQHMEELPSEIGNLIHLRHLDLSDNISLEELPTEIGNLIHLRYLNLSGNEFLQELPENICDMRELEILNICYCHMISKLPQEIHRLVNLTRLHNYHTPSLRQYPQGIAQLTRLRLLNEFWVGKDMGKLGWLKNLNWLGVSLKLVINLTGNMDVEDARDGELANKEYLEDLEIVFDDEIDIGVEDCVWVDVLDALQPHPNLQELIIRHFKSSRLPCWIMSPLNKVNRIFLDSFNHLSSILMPLGKLPFLEELLICRMPELRFVGHEFLGITTETSIVFPKLKRLIFEDCSKWEEWEDITAQEEEEDDKFISFMPRLTELHIKKCNSLAKLPHCLLRKVTSSLEMKLDISGSTQLEQLYGDGEGSPWESLSDINPRIQLINPNDSYYLFSD